MHEIINRSRLIGVPKPAGGIRPIAVGDTLRRLSAKILLATVEDELKNHFNPDQVGVATPNAAETVAN